MLSRIKHLLSEAASNEEFNLNDAKGKLFEILTGSHLRHGADKNGKPAGFLTHYRDEDNKTPEAVHDYIKREMNRRHPGMYDQINQHANEAASHMRNQMAADGHTEFHDVAWTSQPSDHTSFTGVEDPNSDADVMLRTNKGHVGVSLKYGTQKAPNLRNTGLATIESLANLKKGEVTDLYDEHQQNVRRYGYNGTIAQNHAAYKASKGSESAKAAEESSLNTRREIAKRWQDGYSRMSSDELRSKIVRLVSPKTKFQHYRLHTRPTATGAEHNMAGIQEEVEGLLNHYAEFKAVPHSGESINAQILGRHHGSNEWHPVIVHGVKGVSGPMRNFAGTTQLKLRKPKAPKATKSTSKTPALTPTPAPAKPRAVKKPTPKAKLISKAKPIDIPPMDTSRPLSARLGENYLRKIIKESKMANDKKSAEEKGEYDYEGDMAKSQLKSIIANAQRMHDMLEETTNLPEWVQSKITLAEDYILTATSYMEGEMSEEYSIQERINMAKAKMGDVVKDFYKSDAPQFAGRSKKKRRQMAVAAKLSAMRKSKMSEELKGNQHKIDANKNNKIDAHDFKLLRSKLKVKKEEVEQIGEAPYMGKGNHKPGWMLRADPELARKFKEIEDRKKNMNSLMKKYGGKTGDEIAKMRKEEVDLDEAQLAHKVMYAMKDPKKGGKIAVAHYEKEEDAKKFLDDIKKKGGHGIIRKNEPKNEEVEQVDEVIGNTTGYSDSGPRNKADERKFHQMRNVVTKGPRTGKITKQVQNRLKDRLKNKTYMEEVEQVNEKYTGRATSPTTWHVFEKGKSAAAAGPFKTRKEVADWIKKKSAKGMGEEVEQVNEILPFLAGALARGAAARLGASAATRAATGKAASSAARVASYRGRVNVDGGGEEDNGEYEDPRGSVVKRYTSPDMDDTEQEPDNYSTAAAREADRVRKMQNQNRNLRKTTTEEVEQVNELKKSTLGSYIKKASKEYGRDKQVVGRESPDGTVAKARPEVKLKIKNRMAGIGRAADRLTKEEVEQIDEANVKQIKKDLDSGMSHDAVIGKHANKRLSNTDEIRKVIQQHAWEKRMKKEEVDRVDEASYSAKAARAGKDIGKPGKMFSKIAASAAKRYGSEERGKKVAGAVLAKLRAKKG